MKKQFVTYEIAVKLKELGFDKECLMIWNFYNSENKQLLNRIDDWSLSTVPAPMWNDVFDWFEEKHELYVDIRPITNKCMMYSVCFREDEAKVVDIPVTDLRYIPLIISYNKYSQLGLFEILTGEHPTSVTKYDCMEYSILRLIEVVKSR